MSLSAQSLARSTFTPYQTDKQRARATTLRDARVPCRLCGTRLSMYRVAGETLCWACRSKTH